MLMHLGVSWWSPRQLCLFWRGLSNVWGPAGWGWLRQRWSEGTWFYSKCFPSVTQPAWACSPSDGRGASEQADSGGFLRPRFRTGNVSCLHSVHQSQPQGQSSLAEWGDRMHFFVKGPIAKDMDRGLEAYRVKSLYCSESDIGIQTVPNCWFVMRIEWDNPHRRLRTMPSA